MSEQKKEVKEIDLLELFNVIGRGIKNFILHILKAILFLINFGLRKAHIIGIAVVLGAALGYATHLFTKPYYSSGMIIQPNGIRATDLIEYFDDLTSICESGNIDALALAMEISDSAASKIKNIQAYPYIDLNRDGIGDYIDFNGDFNVQDTTQSIIQNRVYLNVEVYESQPKEYLQEGLLNYVNKNEYMIQLNQIRKNELFEQIQQTESEILKLDSLQNKEYFIDDNSKAVPVGTGGYIVYTEKDKKLYYHDKLRLIQSKQDLEKEYELIQGPITIIKNMSELAIEKNPKSTRMIMFGLWFGVIGYFVLLFIKYRERIQELTKNN